MGFSIFVYNSFENQPEKEKSATAWEDWGGEGNCQDSPRPSLGWQEQCDRIVKSFLVERRAEHSSNLPLTLTARKQPCSIHHSDLIKPQGPERGSQVLKLVGKVGSKVRKHGQEVLKKGHCSDP